jgi:hypothetical protein
MIYECFFCGIKFATQHELVEHNCLRREEMEIKEYVCTYCNKRGFFTLEDVLEHEEECVMNPSNFIEDQFEDLIERERNNDL